MKTKIKRNMRTIISILLAVCMIVSCVMIGLVATSAAMADNDGNLAAKSDDASLGANDDSESVGAYNYYLYTGTSDTGLTKVGQLDCSASLPAGNNWVNVTHSESGWNVDYEWWVDNKPKINYDSANSINWVEVREKNNCYYLLINTDVAGTYNFSYNGSNDTLTVTGGTHVTPTWTVAGSEVVFGSDWSNDDDANLMTSTDNVNYSLTKSNVSLTSGTTIEYKVCQTGKWSPAYPSSNATENVTTTGVYTVEVTFNSTTKEVDMELTAATPHTFTVPSLASYPNASSIKATYGNTTAQAGQTLSVPVGGEVTVVITPDVEHSVTSFTTSPSTIVTMNGNSGTFTMPDANTTINNITFGAVTTGTVYFNNMYAEYNMISAYAWYGTFDNRTGEPLGEWGGTTMTKLENSNIWSVKVPTNVAGIVFVGHGAKDGDTSHTDSNVYTIPWTDQSNSPMYTAGLDQEHPDTDGYWSKYTARNNEYTVTDGSTITNKSNLYTGIKATFYDYFTDHEASTYAQDGTAGNGWIEGIANNEYNWHNDDGWDHDPFETLNKAMSTYANAANTPKYDIAFPLYFGTLNYWGSGDHAEDNSKAVANEVKDYYNFYKRVNHSADLSNDHYALTGLTGKTLVNNSIRHYKSGATNENGARLPMFDEDFLSGVNSEKKTLATILRSNTFPVRKEENVGATSDTVWLDENDQWNGSNDHEYIYAWVWGAGKTSKWVKFTKQSGNIFKASGVSGYTGMKVMSCTDENIVDGSSDYGTPNIAYNNHVIDNISISITEKAIYKLSSYNAGSFTTHSTDTITITGGYTYYEYDSENGKDNALITDVNKSDKTARINYYNNNNKVHSHGGVNGFYPFNRVGMNVDTQSSDMTLNDDYAKNLGFGVKLEIPFSINRNGLINVNGDANDTNNHQKFNFSGDDDLWVYIDGNLVLDLGGAHGRTEGTIDFATTTATATTGSDSVKTGVTRNGDFSSTFDKANPDKPHKMVIYYMERGMDQSNLRFGFSFHAITDSLEVEKKVRTNSTDATKKINSGFFTKNSTTTNNNTITFNGDVVSYFEYAYNQEKFNIEHSYSGTNPLPAENGGNITYIRDRDSQSTTVTPTNNKINYYIQNDNNAHFNAQFTKDTTRITLKETFDNSNLFAYTPSFSLYDDAEDTEHPIDTSSQNQYVNLVDNGDGSYSFNYIPSIGTSAMEDLRLRARFSNQMKCHELDITKALNKGTDTSSTFTLEIKFKVGSNDYIAYPLDCKLDDVNTKLAADGTIIVKAGQTVRMLGIPENAYVQIREIGNTSSDYLYDGITVKDETGATVSPEASLSDGIQFQVGAGGNVSAEVKNSKAEPVRISHDIHPSSVGDAYCYVTAKVTDAAGTTDRAEYDKTIGIISVPETYIKRGSTDKLVITLDTVLKDPEHGILDDFFEKMVGNTINALVGTNSTGVHYTADIDKANYTATITITIGDLFDSENKQKTTKLPFYSKIDEQPYNYVVEFTYATRAWGRQTYKVPTNKTDEKFTNSEVAKYLETAQVIDATSQTLVEGKRFKNDGLKKEFLTALVPYVDNFRYDMKWNLTDATVNYYAEYKQLSIAVSSAGNSIENVDLTVHFPYEGTVDPDNGFTPTKDSGKVYYKENGATYTGTPAYMGRYTVNNAASISQEKYLQAAESIWLNDSTQKFFTCWILKDENTGREYARCYSRNLNYAFYQDTIVDLLYNNDSPAAPSSNSPSDRSARIEFLENTRNQWNKLVDARTTWNPADRLISDFVLSFTYDNLQINTVTGMRYGILYETVGDLAVNGSGNYITDRSHYVTNNDGVSAATYKANATSAISTGKSGWTDDQKAKYLIEEKTAVRTTTVNGSGETIIIDKGLDNKNEIEFFYSVAANGTKEREKKYYRVYSYLKDASGNVILSDPIYLTIYDVATIENGSSRMVVI